MPDSTDAIYSARPSIEIEGKRQAPLEQGMQRMEIIETIEGSNGVLFTTDQILLPGKRLELSISWPAQLDNKCQLKLVARGRVARLEQGKAAIEIQQYEFRTTGSKGL